MSAEENFKDFQNFFDTIIKDTLDLDIEFEIETESLCHFQIIFDDQILINSEYHSGCYNFVKTLNLTKGFHSLTLLMDGKTSQDTLIKNGIIVKDKYIRIKKFYLNNYDLVNDYDLRKHFVYTNLISKKSEDVKLGFWSNAQLVINFEYPIEVFFNSLDQRELHKSLQFRQKQEEIVNNLRSEVIKNLDKLVK